MRKCGRISQVPNILDEYGLGDLTSAERKVIKSLAADVLQRKADALNPKQVREVVPISKWLESEYYLGPDYLRVYDFWKDQLRDIYETQYKYSEVIIDGALGTGKSTAAELILLRKLYELSCYDNIPALFNLMAKSRIAFLNFCLTRQQAEATIFGEFRDIVDTVPYFKEVFPRCYDISSILVWPEAHLFFTYGSKASHAIGMNIIGAVLDEANFFDTLDGATDNAPDATTSYSKASRLYNTILQRAESRFLRQGVNASISILVSSSTHANSFTESRKSAAQTNPRVKYIHTVSWDVKPKGTYSKEMFWVFCGTPIVTPFIVHSSADVNQFLSALGLPTVDLKYNEIKSALAAVPPEYLGLFIQVPIDFLSAFEADIITALQNHAGVSVSPRGRLFSQRALYNECVQQGEELGFSHPFTRESFVIAVGDDTNITDFLRRDFRFRDPKKPRFLHIDQSTTTDYTGIASAYIDEWITVAGVLRPVVGVDFMLRITPPMRPRQISIAKIRDFVLQMRNHFGLTLGRVTYDAWGSTESQQTLTENRVETATLSVDRNDDPYLMLCALIYEVRLRIYSYRPFEDELFELVHNRETRKIDHPANGRKDVADALCGAVWGAITSTKTAETVKHKHYLGILRQINQEDPDRDYRDPLENLDWVK